MILAPRVSRLCWPLRLALPVSASLSIGVLLFLPATIQAVAAEPAGAEPTTAPATVEQRLERLEKAVESLTAEIRSLRKAELENALPRVVKAVPDNGAQEVDPNLTELRVTFDRPMRDGAWSWTQRSSQNFPEVTGEIHYLEDQRTCVLPVKLEPGKKYYLSINSERFKNFKDAQGRPAVPYPITFTTRK